MAKKTDMYANVVTQETNMSSANTLSFTEVNIGLSIFDKAGLVISRVEYHISETTLDDLTSDGDIIEVAFGTSNQLANLTPNQQAIIHKATLSRQDLGTTAANLTIMHQPLEHDFSSLPGGGIIITPRPWYTMMNSVGLASAGTVYVRFYFTVVQLRAEEYFELLETRQYFG